MRMHTIEVDEDVIRFLKEHAEPFVDTPNSVLRRALLFGNRPGRPATPSDRERGADILPPVPLGVPKALEQILQVVWLTLKSSRTRSDATHFVARRHGVAPQTVIDKYCRQLGITAAEFDLLLREPDLGRLKRSLNQRFPEFSGLIAEYLS